jgi:hypothetical protein
MTIIKYPLHNLVDKEFETLVALICEEILGIGTIVFSDGKDGGRDAKFTGTANRFPSEANPWNGKFIIQAKHTTTPEASCSDSRFNTILKDELPRLRKLREEGKVDCYLLFTNRKLSGVQDPKIEDSIDEEVGVVNTILGEETIQLWLQNYPKIARTLGLNKLLMPLQFYEKDLQEIIIGFSETKITKEELRTIQSDLTRIPIEEKNRLNNLRKIYFDNVLKESFSDFERIESFIGDPKNSEYKSKYDNTISDLQEEIIIHWDEYDFFEDILNYLYKLILDESNKNLIKNRKLVRVFLHYMYFNCDIGKKVSKNAKT